jgi:hypothetical protein
METRHLIVRQALVLMEVFNFKTMNGFVNANICYNLFDKQEKVFSFWGIIQDEFMFCLQILFTYYVYLVYYAILTGKQATLLNISNCYQSALYNNKAELNFHSSPPPPPIIQ